MNEPPQTTTNTSNVNPTADHNYFSRICVKINLPLKQSEVRKVSAQSNYKEMKHTKDQQKDWKDEDHQMEEAEEKRKMGLSDEDGLKGAQVLLNLASRNSRNIASVKLVAKKLVKNVQEEMKR